MNIFTDKLANYRAGFALLLRYCALETLLDTPTTFTLSIPDASVFSFPNGSLCSEFLDSSTFKFSFKQEETVLSAEAQAAAGIHGFLVRALLTPVLASLEHNSPN